MNPNQNEVVKHIRNRLYFNNPALHNTIPRTEIPFRPEQLRIQVASQQSQQQDRSHGQRPGMGFQGSTPGQRGPGPQQHAVHQPRPGQLPSQPAMPQQQPSMQDQFNNMSMTPPAQPLLPPRSQASLDDSMHSNFGYNESTKRPAQQPGQPVSAPEPAR